MILDSSLGKVDELLHIGQRLRRIALQSAVGGMLLSERIHHSRYSDNGSFIRQRGVLLETNEANLPSPPGTSQA